MKNDERTNSPQGKTEIVIIPDGPLVRYSECRPGLFWADGMLCMKPETTSGPSVSYVVSTGEVYFGSIDRGVTTFVVPCKIKEDVEAQ